MADITDYEAEQIDKANALGQTPVVFVHGLWLLPSSWDRWRTVFEEAGYTTLAPGLARRSEHRRRGEPAPRGLRPQDVGQIADHFEDVIGELTKKPAIDRPLLRRAAHPDPRRPRAARRRRWRSTRRRSAACCRCRSRR